MDKEFRKDDIINLVFDRLKQEGLYFATKDDQGYASAKDLYKLNKEGLLEEKAIEKVITDVTSYLGDGAVYMIDAVNQWIDDCIITGKLGYIDTLNMEFDDNGIIDGNLNIYNQIRPQELSTDVEPKEEEIAQEAELEEKKSKKKKKTETYHVLGVKKDKQGNYSEDWIVAFDTEEECERFRKEQEAEFQKKGYDSLSIASDDEYNDVETGPNYSDGDAWEDGDYFEASNGDETVKISKRGGKWTDNQGNRYMGYLSPRDIMYYYKGFKIVENKKIEEDMEEPVITLTEADKKCNELKNLLDEKLPEYDWLVNISALQVIISDLNDKTDFKYTKKEKGFGPNHDVVENLVKQVFGNTAELTFFDSDIWAKYKAIVRGIEIVDKKTEAKVDGAVAEIPDELLQQDPVPAFSKKDWNIYYNRCKKDYTNVFNGDSNTKISFLQNKAKSLGLGNLEFSDTSWKDDIDSIARAYADSKESTYNKNNNIQESKKKVESFDDYSKPYVCDGNWFRYNYKYNELEHITHSSNEYGPIEVIDSIKLDKEYWENKQVRREYIRKLMGESKKEETRTHMILRKGDTFVNENGVKVTIINVDDNDGTATYKFVKSGNSGCYAMENVVAMLNQNGYKKVEEKKTLREGKRQRLNEENTKSKDLINSMVTAKDFDSDSPQGQIILRTQELFNVLSDRGYDLQVTFDNGESQSMIMLGNQGGSVLITITNTNQPLRAFTSGNFELTDDSIQILNDIKEQITAL